MSGNTFFALLMSRFRRKRLCKLVSVIVIESLLFASIVQADNGKGLAAKSVDLPRTYGSINDRYQGSAGDNLVIHIQDTHTSFSAQKYLAKILEYFHTAYGTDMVALEGSVGKLDASEFSAFPDKNTKEKVADYFLSEGKIDGAEYLCIVENNGQGADIYSLHGVEVEQLYQSNLSAFFAIFAISAGIVVFLWNYG